jgi:hypothetical protein
MAAIFIPVRFGAGNSLLPEGKTSYVNLDHILAFHVNEVLNKEYVVLTLTEGRSLHLDMTEWEFRNAVFHAREEELEVMAEHFRDIPEPLWRRSLAYIGPLLFGSVCGALFVFFGWQIYKSAAGIPG